MNDLRHRLDLMLRLGVLAPHYQKTVSEAFNAIFTDEEAEFLDAVLKEFPDYYAAGQDDFKELRTRCEELRTKLRGAK